MKRKLLAVAVCLFLLVSTCGIFIGVAASQQTGLEPTITVSTANIVHDSSEEVTVTVSVSNNPGFVTATFAVSCPAEKLAFAGASTALEGFAVFVTENNVTLTKTDATADYAENGDILTLKFTIVENCEVGEAAVALTCTATNAAPLDVAFVVVNGGVNVTHDFTNTDNDIAATCTAPAYKVCDCDGCDAREQVEGSVPDLQNHDFTNADNDIAATCTTPAYKVCDRVGCTAGPDGTPAQEEDAEHPALNHKFTNYTYDNNAKCGIDGTQTASCDRGCADITHTKPAPGTALTHVFTTYVSDGNAKCEEDGTKTAKCDHGCGTTDTQADEGSKLGHNWALESTTPATCIQDGNMHYICTHDGEHTKDEAIPATGHTLGQWTQYRAPTHMVSGEDRKTCENCDYYEFKNTPTVITKDVIIPFVIVSVLSYALFIAVIIIYNVKIKEKSKN